MPQRTLNISARASSFNNPWGTVGNIPSFAEKGTGTTRLWRNGTNPSFCGKFIRLQGVVAGV